MHLTDKSSQDTTLPVLYRPKIIRMIVTYILKERKPDISIARKAWIKIEQIKYSSATQLCPAALII